MRETLAGTPQGGVISPLLANIYLNKLGLAHVRAVGRLPTIELEGAGGTQNRNSPLCSHGDPDRHFRSNRMNESLKVQFRHLQRSAYLYIRQSSMRQVIENVESTKRQYALRNRATALGWRDDQIVATPAKASK